ncbi:MAG TPA: SpoIIE family protein phosphatase [Myxococcota bacterium]|jgi:serine phosphatase RsbU (regulator of sigma subunit)|nr:SpoIIE family protein phosphatase [Myxococcota bacterium]
MSGGPPPALRFLDWSVAEAPHPGQAVSGDRHLVCPISGGALLAVVDGLGHGVEAADAAGAATDVLRAHAGDPVVGLVNRCHAALHATRGVVLSLVRIETAPPTITWTGVGNVAGLLLRAAPAAQPAREWLLARGGVVGYQLPPLRAAVLPLAAGDKIVLATDGLNPDFGDEARALGEVRACAERLLARYRRFTDDALVLVACFNGEAP